MYFMFMPSSEIFHFISCSVYNIIKTTKDIFQIKPALCTFRFMWKSTTFYSLL